MVQIGVVEFVVKELMPETSQRNADTTEPIYPSTSRPAAGPVPVLGVRARVRTDTTDAREDNATSVMKICNVLCYVLRIGPQFFEKVGCASRHIYCTESAVNHTILLPNIDHSMSYHCAEQSHWCGASSSGNFVVKQTRQKDPEPQWQ